MRSTVCAARPRTAVLILGASSAGSFTKLSAGEGHRFAKLACDLIDKHGFTAYQAKVHLGMGMVALWIQPIATAIDFVRSAYRTAIETGDLTFACYSQLRSVTYFLLRNDPLDVVWRETEKGLDFVRNEQGDFTLTSQGVCRLNPELARSVVRTVENFWMAPELSSIRGQLTI